MSKPTSKRIGVLALQGGFKEHIDSLNALSSLSNEACAVEAVEVRLPADLASLQGLIIPGGESTTISQLLESTGLREAISKLPSLAIWGTCAGAILLAKQIENSSIKPLGLMDITVARNAFGRQADSFVASLSVAAFDQPFDAVFIRAPLIQAVGAKVDVLATLKDKRIVAARQGHYLATAFHPELTPDCRWHQYFVEQMVACLKR